LKVPLETCLPNFTWPVYSEVRSIAISIFRKSISTMDDRPRTAEPGRKRILSGVQPSGKLHLGNYFGAIKQHIALQNEAECFYFIADFHALTTIHDPRALRENVRDVALDYLALGLDPDKATFFRQSDVPEVTELAWILATVTNMGLLERAVSYKEKIEKGIEASVGLFTYPVLMAADILIYRSHLVPVGKDQVQHIEMTQDMAGRFNRAFGNIFPIPNYRLDKEAKVPGIDGQKMSKSYGNAIEIFAEGKPLKKTVMSIVTDSKTVAEPKEPERCNVFALYSLFATDEEKTALAERYRAGGMGYAEAKGLLLEKITSYFAPARERRRQLSQDPAYVEAVLQKGAQRARLEAEKTMVRVRAAVGLREPAPKSRSRDEKNKNSGPAGALPSSPA
jgi:tryptophanyl-tRNA synthetase